MEKVNRRPLALALTVAGAVARLVPHPWNFAPVGGMSLFAGARLRGWQALLRRRACCSLSRSVRPRGRRSRRT